jgi:hypothetical protein
MINTAQLVQDVLDGKENPLKAIALLKGYADLIKNGIAEIEDAVFTEAEKYGSKTFEDMGYRFSLSDGRRTYDFKHIGEWKVADNNKRSIEDKYKQALAGSERGLMAVSEDGEELELPRVTYSKPSISVRSL